MCDSQRLVFVLSIGVKKTLQKETSTAAEINQ